jgi:hypothetical protein
LDERSNSLIEATGKDRTTKLSNLRIEVKRHVESEGHKTATKIHDAQLEFIDEGIQKISAVAEETTIKVFRTAYYIAKKNRPFSDHEDLVELQHINGVNLGSILHSRHTATSIIHHVEHEMRKQLVLRLVSSGAKLSFLIHESTSLRNKSTL